MKLVKEQFIHNSLDFSTAERDLLIAAHKLISEVREQNIHSCGAEDTFLNDMCNEIMYGILELLDCYSNEYPDKVQEKGKKHAQNQIVFSLQKIGN